MCYTLSVWRLPECDVGEDAARRYPHVKKKERVRLHLIITLYTN